MILFCFSESSKPSNLDKEGFQDTHTLDLSTSTIMKLLFKGKEATVIHTWETENCYSPTVSMYQYFQPLGIPIIQRILQAQNVFQYFFYK